MAGSSIGNGHMTSYHKNEGCNDQPTTAKVQGWLITHHEFKVVQNPFQSVQPENGNELEQRHQNDAETTTYRVQ